MITNTTTDADTGVFIISVENVIRKYREDEKKKKKKKEKEKRNRINIKVSYVLRISVGGGGGAGWKGGTRRCTQPEELV